MSVADYLMLAIRWLHTMSAVAWVGGGMFYLLVLRPAIRRSGPMDRSLAAAIGPEFRGLVDVSIAVLIITGSSTHLRPADLHLRGGGLRGSLGVQGCPSLLRLLPCALPAALQLPRRARRFGQMAQTTRHALHRGHSNTGGRCDSVPAVRAIGRVVPSST